ncbi:MAG: hypothetical protein DRN42_02590, partial [Thermoplasmata archaeon]
KGEKIFEMISAVRRWKNTERIPLGEEITAVSIAGDISLNAEEMRDFKEAVRARQVRAARIEDLKETILDIKLKFNLLGPVYKEKTSEITRFVKEGRWREQREYLAKGFIKVPVKGEDVTVPEDYFEVVKGWTLEGRDVNKVKAGSTLLLIEK